MGVRIQSPQAELGALLAVCTAKEAISTRLLGRIRDAHFHHLPAQQAWRRIKALVKAKGKVPSWEDVVEDSSLDRDCRRILAEYEPSRKVKDASDVNDIVELLDKYRLIRAQLEMADDIAAKMEQDEGFDPSSYVDQLQILLNDMREGTASVEEHLVHFGTDSNAKVLIESVLDQKLKPALIPTGFKTFDKVNGGIPYGELMIVGGATGSGKSAMASVQLLKNMAQHAPAVLVPLEMGKLSMTARLAANLSGIDVGKIIQKKLTQNEVDKCDRAFATWEGLLASLDSRYSIYEPPEDMSLEEILYGIQPFGYKIILIDYVTLLKGMSDDDQWRKLGEVARFAKRWAARTNNLVILLAQLTDEGMIRYSRAMLEHAANAWFFVATAESRAEGNLHIDQPKARNQDPFSFDLGIDYATMRVFDKEDAPQDTKRDEVADDDIPPVRSGKATTVDVSGRGRRPVLDDDDSTPTRVRGTDPRVKPKYVED